MDEYHQSLNRTLPAIVQTELHKRPTSIIRCLINTNGCVRRLKSWMWVLYIDAVVIWWDFNYHFCTFTYCTIYRKYIFSEKVVNHIQSTIKNWDWKSEYWFQTNEAERSKERLQWTFWNTLTFTMALLRLFCKDLWDNEE